ncbi:hypothetical protein MY596_05395 [Haemophilus influenzae]|uniref:Uncharacterized protein n=1 Tax=Haemophilus influenzae TaxID=727 RepID=A0A2S9S0P7_HAEIF|nr:hypothetical protein [Haemophilus influenzae]ADO81640.1 Putative bacteriophage tail collar protein [Haemophilus influenzae R2866]EDK10844.1 hypothetical protein CGSHiII_07038 [Haemophilus influenzae PittII]EEW78402.1 conserved hypothetical protein [Haemophilus influenzae NT127]MCK8794750.1 hypothetical protein [Haemophilus influenzae]MCK8830282.1 hypothetical protein [Haemophilus influenzae]
MKVYFLKSNLNQYQIYPEPEDKTEYVLMDVTDDSALDKKQLILRDGQYIFIDKTPMVTPETIKKLMDDVDDRAAAIYSTWTRFESEYRERQAAAEAYKSANYEGECSRYISDFAQRARLDNKTATNLILTQAAGLKKLQMELANQRMRKYELKAPNLTIEQMQSIHDDIIKQMDNLMEAYQNG